MVKTLKSESSERHWKINGMIEDVQCMQDDYFGLKKRVEFLKSYGKYGDWKDKDTCPAPKSILETLSSIENCVGDLKDTLEVVESFHSPCGGPGWKPVVYLDADDPNSGCPTGWLKRDFDLTDPLSKMACHRPDLSVQCATATFPVSESYSQVCGSIKGYSVGDVGGLRSYLSPPIIQPTVGSFIASGVTLSRGSEHIWSFIAGTPPGNIPNSPTGEDKCPCLTGEETFIVDHAPLPTIVASDYFCESGPPTLIAGTANFFDSPLWDGLDCVDDSQCCNYGTPPIFSKTFTSSTMDDIDALLCVDDPTNSADIGIFFVKLYVR